MRNDYRYLITLMIGAIVFCQTAIGQDDNVVSVEQAVQAYQQALDEDDRDRRVQRFRTAETLFAQEIETQLAEPTDGRVSPDLYVNLGNAALGAERLGPAVLAYRRALAIAPNHSRAIQNLSHARTLLPAWVPKPEPETDVFGSFFDRINDLPNAARPGLAAIVFFTAMLFAAIYLRTETKAWRLLSAATGILWLACLAWSFYDDGDDTNAAAVVIGTEVTARAADSTQAPSRFPEPLPGGTEILVTETRDGWVHASFYDGREAWLPEWAIEPVAQTKSLKPDAL